MYQIPVNICSNRKKLCLIKAIGVLIMYISNHKERFVQEFLALYMRAGNPTLRKITRSINIRIQQNHHYGKFISFQRVSDWKAGKHIPSDFDLLSICLKILFEIIISRENKINFDPKLNLEYWRNLWLLAQNDIKIKQIHSKNKSNPRHS